MYSIAFTSEASNKASVHAKIRRCQVTEQLVFAKSASEMHPVIKAQIAAQHPCFLKALAGSYYRELAVASSYFVHDMINRQDSRADELGEEFRERCGDVALYRLTGQWVDGRYLLPMFTRIARIDQVRAAATATIASAKDYVFG